MDNKKMMGILKIQKANELYVIMSKCTKSPYIHCNEETFDDEVFVYLNEEAGKKDVTELAKKDELVDLIAIPQRQALGFFSSLFYMGVNSLHLDNGTQDEMVYQLEEVVKRPTDKNLPNGQERVENPQFVLTASYYMQKLRKNPTLEMTEELKELQEEMMIHFWEGKLLLAVEMDNNRVPLMKKQDGKAYQPVFTDLQEFQKFCVVNNKTKFKAMKVDASKMPMMVAKEATGAVINPFGVDLQLNIKRDENKGTV